MRTAQAPYHRLPFYSLLLTTYYLPYCTIAVSVTECVRPAELALTVSV
jgi:hypothetical protein